MNQLKYFFWIGSMFFQTAILAETLCGKTVSLVIKADEKAIVQVTDKFILKDEFCDTGNEELNANYKISFYDNTEKVIFEKSFFVEEFSHFEKIDSQKSGKIIKNKIQKKGFERILKIPLNDKIKTAKKYQITSKKDHKISTGEIKW